MLKLNKLNIHVNIFQNGHIQFFPTPTDILLLLFSKKVKVFNNKFKLFKFLKVFGNLSVIQLNLFFNKIKIHWVDCYNDLKSNKNHEILLFTIMPAPLRES